MMANESIQALWKEREEKGRGSRAWEIWIFKDQKEEEPLKKAEKEQVGDQKITKPQKPNV